MKLTAQAVTDLLKACLFAEGEPTDGAIQVEGVVQKFGFNPARIAEHSTQIRELLAELPDEFHVRKGGGWTFLNACQDRHGRQWTDFHQTMEALFCLGIADKSAMWLMPRDLWVALPGGVPYVGVMV